MSLSPDGNFVLTNAMDQTARIWVSTTPPFIYMFNNPSVLKLTDSFVLENINIWFYSLNYIHAGVKINELRKILVKNISFAGYSPLLRGRTVRQDLQGALTQL